jgi:membrane protein YdbS with pleckstrin-like domain
VRSRRLLRADEAIVVSVSPIPEGLFIPALIVAAEFASLVISSNRWTWVHHHQWWLALAIVPAAFVLAARALRWRSHRLTITTQRVIEQRGVLHQRRSAIELADIRSLEVSRGLLDKLVRRGTVNVSLDQTIVALRRLRHPEVIARVIDHVRLPEGEPPSDAPDAAVPALPEAADLVRDDDAQRWWRLFGGRDASSSD